MFNSKRRISLLLGNTLYLVAFGYYNIICFLGYNGIHCPIFLEPRDKIS